MPRKKFSELSKRIQRDYLKTIGRKSKLMSNSTHPNLTRQETFCRSDGCSNPSLISPRSLHCDVNSGSEDSTAGTSDSEEELHSNIDDASDESEIEDNSDNPDDMASSSDSERSSDRLTSESDDERGLEDMVNRRNRDEYPEFDEEPPLYDDAPLSVRESMLMLLSLLLKHNLEQTCLSDIIELLNLHCPQRNLKKNSLYKFKKYFNLPELSRYEKHYYCSECGSIVERPNSQCPACENDTKISHFIELPFVDQLREMYKRRGFYETLQTKCGREIPPETTNDIYDGQLYQKLNDLGFTSNCNNITLSWYVDGIPVFKSSKVSMTPVYLSINELPFSDRTQRENILLAGLLFGSEKVGVDSLLRKLVTQFETLAAGVDVVLQDGNTIKVQGLLLSGTCDLPAKSDILSLIQFNGAYGCPNCEWPGETYRLPSGGTTHVYRFERNLPLRTSEDSIEYAKEALRTDQLVSGWKGPCVISKLMPDFIGGTAIDRMHAVDGGVILKLLKLWFGSSHRSAPFSLLDVKDIINQEMKSIKPPKFVHRTPRSVEELCHWKASELKMWAFYYSLPILRGVMRADFFQNYSLLITGLSILSSDSISTEMIDVAENLLQQFVQGFEALYGLQFCSINIHQLLHLAECVRKLGPLWGYTCYPYEDLNGRLLKTVHGTRHIDSQIATSHMQLIMMRRHLDLLAEGPVKNYCFRRKKQVKICEKLFTSCYSVGTYSKVLTDLPAEIHQAINRSQVPMGRIQVYKRLMKRNKLIISEIYFRDTKTQSSHVQYVHHDEEQIGSIYCFIKVTPHCECAEECECRPMHYAITRKLRCVPVFGGSMDTNNEKYVQLLHLLESHRQDDIIALPLNEIVSVCVCIDVGHSTYIGLPINSHELE